MHLNINEVRPMSILLGELAQTISEALIDANVPYEIIVPRVTQSEPPEDWPTWQPWPGEEVTVEHKMQGFVVDYDEALIAVGVVQMGDVRIVILQPTIPEGLEIGIPDTVIAKGKSYTVLNISEDPAGATLELRAR